MIEKSISLLRFLCNSTAHPAVNWKQFTFGDRSHGILKSVKIQNPRIAAEVVYIWWPCRGILHTEKLQSSAIEEMVVTLIAVYPDSLVFTKTRWNRFRRKMTLDITIWNAIAKGDVLVISTLGAYPETAMHEVWFERHFKFSEVEGDENLDLFIISHTLRIRKVSLKWHRHANKGHVEH